MDDLPKLQWKQPAPRDKFKLFKQRLELFFKMKKKTDDKEKCYYLLRALDDDALEVFNSWNLEAAVAESYKEVIKKFEETLGQTAINFRVARLQLHFMHQDRGETLDSFVTRCRTQALKCEFEAAELEARIIEQIIASTPIQKFQSELLGKDNNLTLEQAVELGRKHEAALFSAERLREMATGNTAISTDTINQKRGPQKQSQC